VHLLASQWPGTPIENPRQISAYRYPPCYGARPPTFARAIRYAGPGRTHQLAVSGTASIVGHVTMHPGDLPRQIRETLRNLESLMDHAGLSARRPDDPPLLLKAYLRHPEYLSQVAPVLRAWAGPFAHISFLHGAICRRALEIEIEAHCARSAYPIEKVHGHMDTDD
jgi:chorismate lyase/3-hydroxybenzoate synthase